MTEADLEELVRLLRKLKAHLKKRGAPLGLLLNIKSMRVTTDWARKLGLES
jgi:hypothetical protein